MAEALQQGLTDNGILQGDLVKLLRNMVALVNELQADHATFRTVVNDLKTELNDVIAEGSPEAVTSSPPAALTNSTPLTLSKG